VCIIVVCDILDFIPPEIYERKAASTPARDVYAWAVTFLQVTQRRVIGIQHDNNIQSTVLFYPESLQDGLEVLLIKSGSKDPNHRPSSKQVNVNVNYNV
jgi:hypothetical protein